MRKVTIVILFLTGSSILADLTSEQLKVGRQIVELYPKLDKEMSADSRDLNIALQKLYYKPDCLNSDCAEELVRLRQTLDTLHDQVRDHVEGLSTCCRK